MNSFTFSFLKQLESESIHCKIIPDNESIFTVSTHKILYDNCKVLIRFSPECVLS
jgi:uncharacterized protein YpmS